MGSALSGTILTFLTSTKTLIRRAALSRSINVGEVQLNCWCAQAEAGSCHSNTFKSNVIECSDDYCIILHKCWNHLAELSIVLIKLVIESFKHNFCIKVCYDFVFRKTICQVLLSCFIVATIWLKRTHFSTRFRGNSLICLQKDKTSINLSITSQMDIVSFNKNF